MPRTWSHSAGIINPCTADIASAGAPSARALSAGIQSHRVLSAGVLCAAILSLAFAAPVSRADLISVAGRVSVSVQETRNGEPGGSAQEELIYPSSAASLPLQAAVSLAFEGDDPAAASVAAQFADPLFTQPNPEEFAINLALLSVSPEIRYSGEAVSEETREVIFTRAQFPGLQAGDAVPLTGRLFIDGALALFSPVAGQDLTGAKVYLEVTVHKITSEGGSELAFQGRVGLEGGLEGEVQQIASGLFPTRTLIRTNLASFIEDFELFEVLILPSITINYSYQARIDEPCTLKAAVRVTASNVEDEVGVAAILGTPVDAIRDVISLVQSESAAQSTMSALEAERAAPSGKAAFPATAAPLLPACGLFGVETLMAAVGLMGLVGWRLNRSGSARRF